MILASAYLVSPLASAITSASTVPTNPVPSYVFIHDPSMIREGKVWYLFSTGDPNGGVNHGNIQIRVSYQPPDLAPRGNRICANP